MINANVEILHMLTKCVDKSIDSLEIREECRSSIVECVCIRLVTTNFMLMERELLLDAMMDDMKMNVLLV